MYIKKIITSMLISMVLLMSLCIPAMANETGKVISVPIITIDKNTDQKTIDKIIDQKAIDRMKADEKTDLMADVKPLGTTLGGAWVIRDGNTSDCEVYLNWAGTLNIQGSRFKLLKIQSENYIGRITFGKFGDGSSYYYAFPSSGSYIGNAYVGDVEIPTSETEIYLTCSDLQFYTSQSASWLSSASINGYVEIN
ncbi:hypothetical protein [Desulfosporosinus fructosivorans]